MTTHATITRYFGAIHKGGWEALVTDDFVFVNSNLDTVAHGKQAYLEGAGRFYRGSTAVEIRQLLIDGNRAAILARYQMRTPKGHTGVCDVAEFLTIDGDKLSSSAIFFDTKALADLMARE